MEQSIGEKFQNYCKEVTLSVEKNGKIMNVLKNLKI
jgi:hypothetical protein